MEDLLASSPPPSGPSQLLPLPSGPREARCNPLSDSGQLKLH